MKQQNTFLLLCIYMYIIKTKLVVIILLQQMMIGISQEESSNQSLASLLKYPGYNNVYSLTANGFHSDLFSLILKQSCQKIIKYNQNLNNYELQLSGPDISKWFIIIHGELTEPSNNYNNIFSVYIYKYIPYIPQLAHITNSSSIFSLIQIQKS